LHFSPPQNTKVQARHLLKGHRLDPNERASPIRGINVVTHNAETMCIDETMMNAGS